MSLNNIAQLSRLITHRGDDFPQRTVFEMENVMHRLAYDSENRATLTRIATGSLNLHGQIVFKPLSSISIGN